MECNFLFYCYGMILAYSDQCKGGLPVTRIQHWNNRLRDVKGLQRLYGYKGSLRRQVKEFLDVCSFYMQGTLIEEKKGGLHR